MNVRDSHTIHTLQYNKEGLPVHLVNERWPITGSRKPKTIKKTLLKIHELNIKEVIRGDAKKRE